MSKELTTTEQKELATMEAEMQEAFGNTEVSASDIMIPKLMVMQGLSKLVIDGVAKFGDFVDSTTEEVIGNMKEPFDLIPFHMEKLWYISEKNGDDYEFSGIEAVTPHNENLPYEDILNGKAIKRQMVRNFYCMNPKDMSLPMIVSFKGMSTRAGKQLATLMYMKNRAEGKQPPAYHITLTGEKTSNDKGTFVTLKVTKGSATIMPEMREVLKWYTTINSGKTKVHEEAKAEEAKQQF
jgi:hypothetical protein